jgi:hypothetical protein
MYVVTIWEDSVRDPARTYTITQNADGTVTAVPAGRVVQQGTNQSATNYNHMENGILDANLASGIMLLNMLHMTDRVISLEAENLVEIGTLTLNNTSEYPFNNSAATVALSVSRDTTNYLVETELISYTGGLPGDIVVSDKALNGFKLAFDGSASSVTLKYIVKGGISS